MNAARLKILEQFYTENPNDPFNLYALALEYLHSDASKSAALFDRLLKDHENYLPTYYQAVSLFASQNQLSKALNIGQVGIEKALAAKELKTAGELRSLTESIDDDQ